MRTSTLVGLAAVLSMAAAADSRFQASESHSTQLIAEGERKGWTEHVQSVRFGAYGLSVTQRLDPDSGLPQQGRFIWGDAFVGISGDKPAAYMASNWSPWSFLSCAVTLDGDAQPLPDPAMRGLCVYAGLREVGEERIVADAIWQDAAGGYLRARMSGWRGAELFGMALRYFPAPGRTLSRLSYTLTCQPYDYSDRGYWERQRWYASATGSRRVPDKTPAPFDAAQEPRFVFHNRFAQTDSGTFLALDERTVSGGGVACEGNTVKITLVPADLAEDAVLLLGQWVSEPYSRAVQRFLSTPDGEFRRRLDDVASLEPAQPALPRLPADAQGLLDGLPQVADRLRKTERELAEALEGQTADAAGPQGEYAQVQRLLALARLRERVDELARELRGQWVRQRAWQGH